MTSRSDSQVSLRVSGVCHRFGDIVAADRIDLEVGAGEVHCLLGPSGSGKSTLLRLIAGLEALQQGTISIAGVEVAGDQVHRDPEDRSVGFVFQDYALFPHLNVLRNVTFGMDRGSRADHRRAAIELLERVDMAASASAMPHTLSGGQQQRVALARALAREPVIMLLDEPFSGLDERLRGEVRRTTLEVLRSAGVATVMVSHDPEEALLASDVVSVLRSGRLLQTGSPSEVYHRPAGRWVAEVFGPVNRMAAVVRSGFVMSPWGELEASSFDEGQRVEILVRPAALELSRSGGRVRGEILSVEIAGDSATLTVTLEDHDLKVQDFVREGWQVGDQVSVSVAVDSMIISDRSSI